jgi:hypothetical protein
MRQRPTRLQGKVAHVAGVCQVFETVDAATLTAKAGDHRWVLGIVGDGLRCVTRTLDWQCDELEGFFQELAGWALPLGPQNRVNSTTPLT